MYAPIASEPYHQDVMVADSRAQGGGLGAGCENIPIVTVVFPSPKQISAQTPNRCPLHLLSRIFKKQ